MCWRSAWSRHGQRRAWREARARARRGDRVEGTREGLGRQRARVPHRRHERHEVVHAGDAVVPEVLILGPKEGKELGDQEVERLRHVLSELLRAVLADLAEGRERAIDEVRVGAVKHLVQARHQRRPRLEASRVDHHREARADRDADKSGVIAERLRKQVLAHVPAARTLVGNEPAATLDGEPAPLPVQRGRAGRRTLEHRAAASANAP